MGEKGNLLDTTEEVFANLAEQGPQFWLAYKQYRQDRLKSAPAQVDVEQGAGARDPAAQWSMHPGAG
jgi:hypothetical protein